MNQVERQQALGILIIFTLLLVYMFYFAPQSSEPASPSVAPSEASSEDKASVSSAARAPRVVDSVMQQSYGVFAPLLERTPSNQPIRVETEALELRFQPQGGALTAVRLRQFLRHDQSPLWLMDSLQTQLERSFFYNGRRIKLSELYFRSNQPTRIELRGSDTLELRFEAVLADGASIHQLYTIPATGYQLHYQIEGLSSYVSDSKLQLHWQQKVADIEKNLDDLRQNIDINYYTSEEGLEELEALGPGTRTTAESTSSLEWISIQEKFFLLSILPETRVGRVELSLEDLPLSELPYLKEAEVKLPLLLENEAISSSYRIYVGPNDLQLLTSIHSTFEENLYLGWNMLGWINRTFSAPIFYALLKHIDSYGWIIVVLVLIIRLVLAPLTYRSYIGMAKMRLLKPEIDEIKAAHPDDLRKQQSETMRIYQLAGINPLSGCIPLILQMPVILSMFYFFPRMIDLRQAQFLWAEDLSSYDSILSLPFHIPMYGSHVSLFTLLMTVSTIFYTMLNAQMSTSTPQHMKIVQYMMPIVFLVFLNSYSSGLTFYYFVSNLVAMGQQYLIRYFINDVQIRARLEENKKKNAGKKKSSFQQRLEEAMKQQQSQSAQKKLGKKRR